MKVVALGFSSIEGVHGIKVVALGFISIEGVHGSNITALGFNLLPGLLRLKEGDKQNKLHKEGSKTKDAYLTDEES